MITELAAGVNDFAVNGQIWGVDGRGKAGHGDCTPKADQGPEKQQKRASRPKVLALRLCPLTLLRTGPSCCLRFETVAVNG